MRNKTGSGMCYHEYYGDLPKSTLRLVKKYNVSPADYTMLVDSMGTPAWREIESAIVDNSASGYYRPVF